MAVYPETITLIRGSEEYENLARHSGLIQNIIEMENGNIKLSADSMFPIETPKEKTRLWKIFVDIFFPELAVRRFFVMRDNKVSVDPARGTLEDLKSMLDYMMVDEPDTMMEFAKEQARKAINAPAPVVPRGVGVTGPGAGAAAYAARQAAREENNGFNAGSENNNWENNESENNEYFNNINIGLTEEEEALFAKLRNQNYDKFAKPLKKQGGSRRSNRRTRRSKKHRKGTHRARSRTHRKVTRCANRK